MTKILIIIAIILSITGCRIKIEPAPVSVDKLIINGQEVTADNVEANMSYDSGMIWVETPKNDTIYLSTDAVFSDSNEDMIYVAEVGETTLAELRKRNIIK